MNKRFFPVILKTTILCLWVIFLFALDLLGQDNINNFNHISTSDRFSLSSVTSIGQDKKGFMWFGTRNGLARYDGLELKFIKRDISGNSFFSSNDINDIYLDSRDNIWIATSDGLSVYYPKTDSIHNFPNHGLNNISTSGKVSTCVREMASGEIWVGTSNGLNIYDPKTGTFRWILPDPAHKNSIHSGYINCLYQKKDGTIWVGTNDGLHQLISKNKGQYQFKIFQHRSGEAKSLVHNDVNVLQEDKAGNLWVGTQKGLDYFKESDNTFIHVSRNAKNWQTSDLIRAMTFDRRGRLWVGTYDGIALIDSNQVKQYIKHNPDLSASLEDNKIRALFTDKNGSVWVGSYYGGINYWDDRQLNFTLIDEGNGRKLGFKVVSAIVQDGKENIYFGTEGEGVSIFKARSNKYEYINHLGENLKIGAVKTLFLSGRTDLWIGTFNTGLIYYNTETGKHWHYTHNPEDEQSLSSNKVLGIVRALNNKFWVGTLDGGLNLFDPQKGTFKQIKSIPNDNTSINSNSVRTLIRDRKGDLYVGTPHGLSVLRQSDMEAGAPYKFARLVPTIAGAPRLNILDIFEDASGRIWVGTIDYGLLQVKNGKLHPIATEKGTSVYSIVQDADNILWLSSSEGIIKYNPQNNALKIYNSKDGVPANEFTKSSKLFAQSGRVYFGGASGVTSFRPEELDRINKYAPAVVITGFKLFDKSLEAGDSTGILKYAIEETQHINLDYDQNIFTISFAMPNFIKTGNNIYQYRLKGLDDKWTTTTTPTVSFTIQRGGDYLFEVKGENSDGFETSRVTALAIEVNSPPWRTWWAYTLYCLVILSAFLIFVYFFQSRIKLQHKLDMETREFLHQQEVNKQKLQFFTNISHEFRTPLTLISGPLQKLIEDYKGPHKLFRQLLVIKKNTDQLFKLINELLDFRKLEEKQIRLQAAEGNIVPFLQEIFLSFQQQAKYNKFTYTFETESEEILVYFDRNKLEKVFYNLLANAFKHTPRKGSVAMQLRCTASQIEIEVKDNGAGMEANQLTKIFDQFYEIPGQKAYGQFQQSSGIGLAIVKSVVDLHKGSIRVESEQGAGSSFIVSLPLGRGHLTEDELIKEFKDSEDIGQYTHKPLPVLEMGLEYIPDFALEEEGNRKCVLVVEDNPEVGQFIRNVLADYYKVVLVENGVLGCQSAITMQPDLIISDMMMPEMDGIEFCSRIKSDIRTSHIPFILLSARTSLVYKYDGLESGADDYLYKPFEIKELLLKCKNIIHTHDRLKEKFLNSGVLAPAEMAVNSLDETMMHKAFGIVKENIANEFFGVEQFAEELGISRSLLFTKFKAWTDQTPNDFILSMRMKQAAQLIELNNFNISEIGYKVGFKDPSYFSKIFKKHYQLTPKAYAEKFRAGFQVG